MAVMVKQILEVLDEIAPPELQESYDNVGLLAGHPQRLVERVLVALDLTEGAVEEAREKDVQLIVTHHPILFRGRKNVREDDVEGAAICALIRAGISLIAVHTNFDNAPCGVNDALAQKLGLQSIEVLEHGLRIGNLPDVQTTGTIGALVEEKLCSRARVYTSRPDVPVKRVAVCGGAGGEFFKKAALMGAQAFVTGEIRHHDALAAVAEGICVIEAGHYETEHIALKLLTDSLQARTDELQYNITVSTSTYEPFWRFRG